MEILASELYLKWWQFLSLPVLNAPESTYVDLAPANFGILDVFLKPSDSDRLSLHCHCSCTEELINQSIAYV